MKLWMSILLLVVASLSSCVSEKWVRQSNREYHKENKHDQAYQARCKEARKKEWKYIMQGHPLWVFSMKHYDLD